MDVNGSKLNSPIVLIDPTYKQRNALAALSDETFDRFKKVCKKFLDNPNAKAFEVEKVDLEKVKKNAKVKKQEFLLVEAKTGRQEGDIAGSKLIKFYKHFVDEVGTFFEIKNKGFNYNGKKSARYFLVLKSKGEQLFNGPSVKDKKNVLMFKKKHKKTFVKSGRIYSKIRIDFNAVDFFKKWVVKNKKRVNEMGVSSLKIVN